MNPRSSLRRLSKLYMPYESAAGETKQMISLRSYLRGDGVPDSEATYRNVVDLIIQGIALHTVHGEEAAYEQFQADVERLANTLAADAKPAELMVAAGELTRALEDYGRSTTEFIERQNCELHNMVSMLTQTVIKVGANSEASAAKLREIEKALAQARIVEDIKVLKMRLGECLNTVHAEAERQKAEGKATIAKLQSELSATRDRAGTVARPKEVDTVSGMPSKREAEKALRSLAASPEDKYVIVVVVNRVNAINARFGYAVGDQILTRCAQQFRTGLAESDELYRWQGPAFLAILPRKTRVDEVRSEIRRFADEHLEQTIEIGNRTVIVPVSSNWSVLTPSSSFDALLKKIEAFTAAQVSRDYA